MLGEDDELLDVRRSPRTMLAAGAHCLAGEGPALASWHRVAVSAHEAVLAMQATEQRAADRHETDDREERVVVDLEHYRNRRGEALVALRKLGLTLEDRGHLAASAIRLMAARIELHGADVDLRGYAAALEDLVTEAGEEDDGGDAEDAALRRLDQRREEDGPHVRLW